MLEEDQKNLSRDWKTPRQVERGGALRVPELRGN